MSEILRITFINVEMETNMKKILVTGLCTLHWGRLQYGNVGNYYIVEPLFRLLHKYFPQHIIATTFQMTEEFSQKEKIEILPMQLYYNWDLENDLKKAYNDVEKATLYAREHTGDLTEYGKIVAECDLVLNVSGDMWGDNAEHVGHQRFLVDCLKMRTAQLLGIKTVLYAVTPGPFNKVEDKELALQVFNNFSMVVIREKLSKDNLIKWGFLTSHVVWAPCPSFLFEPNKEYQSKWIRNIEQLHQKKRKIIGLTFGGFNMPVGPYDMWPREQEQYTTFLNVAEYIINELKADIIIFSHTNGFELPPYFKLINGRDYIILNQFYKLLIDRNQNYREHVILVDEPILPCNIKKIIGELDMLITGRVHASVAATSQCIPTVYIEYDRNVIYSDKMYGFSSQLGMEKYVCIPEDYNNLVANITECYHNIDYIKQQLEEIIPLIRNQAEDIFENIRTICEI